MKKFKVKFSREFEVDVEAESGTIAEAMARSIITQFPPGTCKLLSVIAEGHGEMECAGCAVDPMNPYGKPRGPKPDGHGGTPGTPVVRQEVLVDQVAEAA